MKMMTLPKEQVSYHCNICKDQGYIYINDDGYEIAIKCKCQVLKEAEDRLSKSGLGNLLETKTIDNYIAKEGYQKHIKEMAIDYVGEYKNGNKFSFAILGQSGCVDAETEYFNGTEWVKISEYKSEKVLQYNPDTKQANLTKPSNYIAKPAEKLYRIKTMRGSINQVLSSDHDFAYITSKGNMLQGAKKSRKLNCFHGINWWQN